MYARLLIKRSQSQFKHAILFLNDDSAMLIKPLKSQSHRII